MTAPASGTRRHRAAFFSGLGTGPVLALLSLLVLLLTGLGAGWWLALAWPTLGALALAARPARRGHWLSVAAGCAVGTVLVVGLVAAIIAAVAWMLSDPA